MLRKLKFKDYSFYYNIFQSKNKASKQTLVFLHGFLEDSSMWDCIISEFLEYNIITLDLPGHGKSSVFSENTSMMDMAMIVNGVLTLEGVDTVSIIGHSMGGYVALELSQIFSGKIKELILYHSSLFSDSELKKEDRLRAVKAVEFNHHLFIKNAIPNLFSSQSKISKANEIADLISIALNTPEKGVCAALLGMRERRDFSNILPLINSNVVLLAGDNDPIMPLVKLQNHFGLDDLTYEIMEGVGHMSYIENTSLSINILKKYISNN